MRPGGGGGDFIPATATPWSPPAQPRHCSKCHSTLSPFKQLHKLKYLAHFPSKISTEYNLIYNIGKDKIWVVGFGYFISIA